MSARRKGINLTWVIILLATVGAMTAIAAGAAWLVRVFFN